MWHHFYGLDSKDFSIQSLNFCFFFQTSETVWMDVNEITNSLIVYIINTRHASRHVFITLSKYTLVVYLSSDIRL